MTSKELAGAARYIDELASKGGLERAVESLGPKRDDVEYVTEQRALRVILLLRGESPAYNSQREIRLSTEERQMLTFMKCVHLDGICIGLAAAQGLSAPLESTGPHRDN